MTIDNGFIARHQVSLSIIGGAMAGGANAAATLALVALAKGISITALPIIQALAISIVLGGLIGGCLGAYDKTTTCFNIIYFT